MADRLVLGKVREALGLENGRVLVTAAAPLSIEIQEFFGAFVVINEVYGQSEDTGPTAMTVPGRTKFGSVGPAYPGVEVKIADDGEILVKGRNVFMGYYKDDAGHGGDAGRRLAALGRPRRVRRRRLPVHHRSQEGHHHHGRRQERRPDPDGVRPEEPGPRVGGRRDR